MGLEFVDEDSFRASNEIACECMGMDAPRWIETSKHGRLRFMKCATVDEDFEYDTENFPRGWKIVYNGGIFG